MTTVLRALWLPEPNEQYLRWSDELEATIMKGVAAKATSKGQVERSHFVAALFIFEDGKPVAKACVYQQEAITYEGEATLMIGNVACIAEQAVFDKLIEQVAQLAAARNVKHLIGPIDGSTWAPYRCHTTAQYKPFFTEPVQKDYEAELWQEAGFSPWHTYLSQLAGLPATEVMTQENLYHLQNFEDIQLRPIRREALAEELQLVYPMVMKGFQSNPLFTRLTEEEFIEKFSALGPFLDEATTMIAFRQKVPVAFLLCLPDHLEQKKNTLIVKTIARKPEVELKGLMTAMGAALYKIAAANGYRQIIHAFIHDGNRSRKISSKFGGFPIRRYALFHRLVEQDR